jgi:hypothetical protein
MAELLFFFFSLHVYVRPKYIGIFLLWTVFAHVPIRRLVLILGKRTSSFAHVSTKKEKKGKRKKECTQQDIEALFSSAQKHQIYLQISSFSASREKARAAAGKKSGAQDEKTSPSVEEHQTMRRPRVLVAGVKAIHRHI